MIQLKISKKIGNEWAVRGIWDVIPELPEVPYLGGMVSMPVETAMLVAKDCEFMLDPYGPDLYPGERAAYAALLLQIKSVVAKATGETK